MDYFLAHENSSNSHLTMQTNPTPFDHHFDKFLAHFPIHQTSLPMQEFAHNSSSVSNNSTSDDADENQFSSGGIIDERKRRRMISNRESARRSRMRKQKHLDELWSQVLRLRTENHNLVDRLNVVSESHDRVLQENARLKEEATDLRGIVTELQICNSYSIFKDLEDIPCNIAHGLNEYTCNELSP
ncbi:Basic leucine-zipper 42 [Dorcoceras hygrometricum]|uniref:Basic leucine-zipper 42 n=1 Tax=Dorcoceras hygrometricum TaxID=472368 RepID=A0A2Z7B0T2_9LAMI|nr:Basic leucine-zipper 42 [Dorcoceras hygrometricum]